MSKTFKLALHNFLSHEIAWFLVDEIAPPKPEVTKEVKHHVYVIDASGSMCGVIRDTRAMIEKVMTIEEFADDTQLVSLLSYSSRGDVIQHFARVPVKDVLKPGSRYVEEIRKIDARGLTCVSQAFKMALDLVKTETTAISLHTDGFFNDPSPTAEFRAMDALVERARMMKNVFCNTIAYGWADYVVMSKIANALSGKCVKAESVKDVYNALHDTQALLSGRLVPAVVVAKGDADYQVAINVSQKKINGTTTDLVVRGVRPDDALGVYRFRKVTQAVYNGNNGLRRVPNALLIAFARSKLAEGSVNEAKFALTSLMNLTLLSRHAKALTNTQLTAMAVDLENALFMPEGMLQHVWTSTPGLPNANAPSLLQLFDLLSDRKDQWTLNLPSLLHDYKRMSMKKLSGTWSHESNPNPTPAEIEQATFLPCPYRLEPIGDATASRTGGFSINNAEANVNLLVVRRSKLMERDDKGQEVEVKSIAGLSLEGRLTSFNNYTVVGNGDVNVKHLPIQIERATLHFELKAKGFLPVDSGFVPSMTYSLSLEDFPVVPYTQEFGDLPGDLVLRMAKRRALLSLCKALLEYRAAGASGPSTRVPAEEPVETVTGLTIEQEQELARFCLKPNFNFSPPTRTPYKDRAAAITAGLLDTRPAYKVDIGDKDLLSLRSLPSANEFFGRRFLVKCNGAANAKSKVVDLLEKGALAEAKPVGPRMVIGPVDDLLFPLFSAWANVGPADPLVEFLVSQCKIDEGVARVFAIEKSDVRRLQEIATEVQAMINASQELDYANFLRPLAFYIGASGLVPDGFGFEVLDGEKLKKKFPKIKKTDDEATYLVAGDLIVTISCENVDVLTPAGLAAVKELQKGGTPVEE